MINTIRYIATEKLKVPRPVDRIEYLSRIARNKKIIDLGAYDETAFDKKNKKDWLHGRIAKSAAYTLGIDSSEKLPPEGVITSTKSKIVKGSIFELGDIIGGDEFDIIIAGELIEHLPNTLDFFCSLTANPTMRGKKFVLSTPNAVCLSNIILGIFNRENNDVNHLQVYSYKTLHTLFLRAGFQNWSFIPYYEKFPEMILRTRGIKKLVTITFQKTINTGEFLFPLLSGGWIVEIMI